MLFGSKSSLISDFLSKADGARDARDWTTAAQFYSQALAIDPKMSAIWIQLGHATKESGDVEGAEGAYRNAIELSPEDSDAHLQLGHALKLRGRIDKAVDAYIQALALDPKNKHARRELVSLGFAPSQIKSHLLAQSGRAGANAAGVRQIAFDVSDLLHYFLDARTPTGIQRVQINIVTSVLAEDRQDIDVLIVCFTSAIDFWSEVSPEDFRRLTRIALAGGDPKDPIWRKAVEGLHADLAAGDPVVFASGACLLNLGTSWWLQNYFLMVRYAKERFNLQYVPFVHDFIPVVTPEHCIKALTQDFITWLLGVFHHADGYIVNSDATAADLVKVAETLGHIVQRPKVVRLDGAFASPDEASRLSTPSDPSQILSLNGLADGAFVLFVSTIESRKNHILAFDVWSKLIKKRGLGDTPRLVCVGNPGWMVEAAMARLNSSDLLAEKVTILSKISDAELSTLYRACAFTIYPSSYEGWGLPVTECLITARLAWPRMSVAAGGGRKLRGLFRSRIRKRPARQTGTPDRRQVLSFRPRAADSTSQTAGLKHHRQRDRRLAIKQTKASAVRPTTLQGAVRSPFASEAATGVYHRFSRNLETRIWKSMSAGEVYRVGLGWNFCDDWGCWMKGPVAEIAFRIPETSRLADGRYTIFICLRGHLPSTPKPATPQRSRSR